MNIPKIKKPATDNELLGLYCDNLMEHFDSVVIIVTKHNPHKNETPMNFFTRGNVYANISATQMYLQTTNQTNKGETR